jgi:hypothetical protein
MKGNKYTSLKYAILQEDVVTVPQIKNSVHPRFVIAALFCFVLLYSPPPPIEKSLCYPLDILSEHQSSCGCGEKKEEF